MMSLSLFQVWIQMGPTVDKNLVQLAEPEFTHDAISRAHISSREIDVGNRKTQKDRFAIFSWAAAADLIW